MSPTSYQTAPPRGVAEHPTSGATGGQPSCIDLATGRVNARWSPQRARRSVVASGGLARGRRQAEPPATAAVVVVSDDEGGGVDVAGGVEDWASIVWACWIFCCASWSFCP